LPPDVPQVHRGWRDYALLDIATTILDRQQQLLALAKRRFAGGIGTQLDVSQAQTPLPEYERQIDTIEESIALAKNQLAALAGKGPGAGESISRPTLALDAPDGLPSSVPVELIGHRPDIVAARWMVTAQARGIDAAKADLGLPASIQAEFQGTARAFQASLTNQPLLILAAIVTVYILLGILYESYIHPVTILSTLPSAGVGALLSLMLFRIDFSVIALIGIILLIGIVEKNAIMMIDFALDAERKEGKPPEEAIFQAAQLRFRPILMTTFAALFAGVPLAVGSGIGSELRRPLGIAIVGGLIFSQMLTLFTTPVIYLAFDRLARRVTRRAKGSAAPEMRPVEGW